MLKKTIGLVVLAFVVLAFTAFMPVAADDLESRPPQHCPPEMHHSADTGATVDGCSCSTAPIVKAKWEQNCFPRCSDQSELDASLRLPSDDAYEHGDMTCGPGGKRIAKFFPTCNPCQDKCIQLWAICADKVQGVEDIANVYYKVTGPCGDVLFEGCMDREATTCYSKCQFIRAWNKGIVTRSSCEYTPCEIMKELCLDPPCGITTAGFWMTEIEIPYCWAAGDYQVEIYCDDGALCDHVTTKKSKTLRNFFKMMRCPCCDVDFESVDYGTVGISTPGTCEGDWNFDPPDSLRPTLRNLGNVNIGLEVAQDDMGLGTTCDWNIEYDGALNNEDQVWYDPSWHQGDTPNPSASGFWNLLPGCVTRCQDGKICFSVHVKHAPSGPLDGDMMLRCVDLDQEPCCDCEGKPLDTKGNPV